MIFASRNSTHGSVWMVKILPTKCTFGKTLFLAARSAREAAAVGRHTNHHSARPNSAYRAHWPDRVTHRSRELIVASFRTLSGGREGHLRRPGQPPISQTLGGEMMWRRRETRRQTENTKLSLRTGRNLPTRQIVTFDIRPLILHRRPNGSVYAFSM